MVAALLGALASTASAQQSSVMGTWMTASGAAQIRIGPCPDPANGPICGTIVSLINPKGPDGAVLAPEAATDYHNTDPALRARNLLGLPLIWGFKATPDPTAFQGGQISHPSHRNTPNPT